jgi:hypothetical protein
MGEQARVPDVDEDAVGQGEFLERDPDHVAVDFMQS